MKGYWPRRELVSESHDFQSQPVYWRKSSTRSLQICVRIRAQGLSWWAPDGYASYSKIWRLALCYLLIRCSSGRDVNFSQHRKYFGGVQYFQTSRRKWWRGGADHCMDDGTDDVGFLFRKKKIPFISYCTTKAPQTVLLPNYTPIWRSWSAFTIILGVFFFLEETMKRPHLALLKEVLGPKDETIPFVD